MSGKLIIGPVLIGRLEKTNELIKKTFSEQTDILISQTSTSLSSLEALLHERKPALAIISPDFSFDEIEKIIIDNEYSLHFVMVIVLVRKIKNEILKKALKLGISDILKFPFDNEELKCSLTKIRKIQEQFSSNYIEDSYESKKQSKLFCKKIMVFGTKGGAGKTFVSTSLAVKIRKQTSKDVVLFDMHYDTGDASLVLNIFPRQTIFDLTMVKENITPEFLDSFLSVHPSGIKVLSAPTDPSQAELIEVGTTLNIFNMLNKASDYMIIDSPSRFSDETLAVLKKIDWLCMVSTMDVASIKNLKVSLRLLNQLKFPEHQIITIMNRAYSKVGIDLNEIEAAISRKIDIFIPSSIMVPVAMNKGMSVAELYPRSAVAASINKLTGMVLKK